MQFGIAFTECMTIAFGLKLLIDLYVRMYIHSHGDTSKQQFNYCNWCAVILSQQWEFPLQDKWTFFGFFPCLLNLALGLQSLCLPLACTLKFSHTPWVGPVSACRCWSKVPVAQTAEQMFGWRWWLQTKERTVPLNGGIKLRPLKVSIRFVHCVVICTCTFEPTSPKYNTLCTRLIWLLEYGSLILPILPDSLPLVLWPNSFFDLMLDGISI